MDLFHSAHCEISTPDGVNCTCGIRSNAKDNTPTKDGDSK